MTASTYLAGIVDGIMVGNILGTVELYAVNLTSCIIFLRSIPIAISTYGGNTLSIIRKSKRDQNGADTVFTASFWLGIISTVIISALGIAFIVPSANLLSQGNVQITDLLIQYLLPLWLRTDGMRKLATALPIVANIINLSCDYLYMAVFGWGIAGASWATLTGYAVGTVLTLIYFKSKKRTVHFTKEALRRLKEIGKIISIGLPSALIYVCNFLRLFFTNAIILSATGVVGGKIASVSFSLNSLAFIFVEGASMTLLPILGALYGEKDTNGQKLTLRYGAPVRNAVYAWALGNSTYFVRNPACSARVALRTDRPGNNRGFFGNIPHFLNKRTHSRRHICHEVVFPGDKSKGARKLSRYA